MKKQKTDLVRGWLEKARRDRAVVERELAFATPFTDVACFHAQQAAEKYLKAYLVWYGIGFPKTHAVEDLVLLAAQRERAFEGLRDTAATLTPYAVEARYPEFEEPLLEDAHRALEVVTKIRDVVLQALPKQVVSG